MTDLKKREFLPAAWAKCLNEARNALGVLPCSEIQSELYLTRFVRELMFNADWLRSECEKFTTPSRWPENQQCLLELPVLNQTESLLIGNHQVMHKWQFPLMQELARVVTAGHGDVLEVGFGLGIASDLIQKAGVQSHTIIEAHPKVFEHLKAWKELHTNRDIKIIQALWSDALSEIDTFDGILFDPYPLDESEYRQYWLQDVTFASHFFKQAARLLRPGGTFTYFSNEIDSLSREHQRALLKHFQRLEVSIVENLEPPEGCQYWWAPTMVVVKAIKSS